MGGEQTGRRVVVCHHAGVWPWSGLYLVVGAALFFAVARDLTQPSQSAGGHSDSVPAAPPPHATPPARRDEDADALPNPNHRYFQDAEAAVGATADQVDPDVPGTGGGGGGSQHSDETLDARRSPRRSDTHKLNSITPVGITPVPTAAATTTAAAEALASPSVIRTTAETAGMRKARPRPATATATAIATGHVAMIAMDGSGKWVARAADRLRDIACTLRQVPGVTVSFFLQVPAQGYDAGPIAEWNARRNVCNSSTGTDGKAFHPFEVLRDPPFVERQNAPKKRGHQDPGKIHRLAVFRDHFRDELRTRFATAGSTKPDAVVLVDGDLMSFPAADAIERVRATSSTVTDHRSEQPAVDLCLHDACATHFDRGSFTVTTAVAVPRSICHTTPSTGNPAPTIRSSHQAVPRIHPQACPSSGGDGGARWRHGRGVEGRVASRPCDLGVQSISFKHPPRSASVFTDFCHI